jgi:hypothetical protein
VGFMWGWVGSRRNVIGIRQVDKKTCWNTYGTLDDDQTFKHSKQAKSKGEGSIVFGVQQKLNMFSSHI